MRRRETAKQKGEGNLATIVHEIDEKGTDSIKQTGAGWRCMLQVVDSLLGDGN